MKPKKKLLFLIFLLLFTPIVYAQTITSATGLYALPFQSREEIETFLRTAKIVKDKMLGVGITNPHKFTLDDGKIQAYGVWKNIDERRFGITQLAGNSEVDFKDSWKLEIAAYEIDKLLGLDMVPVTVERSYKGSKGSLQIWVPNCVTEDDRLKKSMNPPDPASWRDQILKVRLFDALIYNIDRNQGNLLISPGWKIYMIDHSRTFKNLNTIKNEDDITAFSRSFMEAIRKLDQKSIKEHCGKYLMGTEIENLLKRRDLLVQLWEKLTTEKGDTINLP